MKRWYELRVQHFMINVVELIVAELQTKLKQKFILALALPTRILYASLLTYMSAQTLVRFYIIKLNNSKIEKSGVNQINGCEWNCNIHDLQRIQMSQLGIESL